MKWRKAEDEINYAVKTNDLTSAHRLASRIAKFQKSQPAVKSLILDSGLTITDSEKMDEYLTTHYQ